MTDLLTGKIAKAIFKGFKGKLLKGELRRETPSATLDTLGDPDDTTISYFSIEGFTDEFTEFYKMKAGIPESDVKVNIFSQSAPTLIPTKDDKVSFNTAFGIRWYQLRTVGVDPAGALFTAPGFEIDPPIDAS